MTKFKFISQLHVVMQTHIKYIFVYEIKQLTVFPISVTCVIIFIS